MLNQESKKLKNKDKLFLKRNNFKLNKYNRVKKR